MVELWFFYVLSSVIIFGFSAILDKIILTKYLNPFSYCIVFTPAVLVMITSVLLFVPINFSPIPFYSAFFAGFTAVIGYYFYAFAIKREEASRIAALTSLYPAFVAVLAAILIGEVFSLETYVGVAIMILGAVLISYKKGALKKMIPLAIILIIISANFLYAFEQTISKISLAFYSFWQFFVVYMIGRTFMLLPPLAVPGFRKTFVGGNQEVKNENRFPGRLFFNPLDCCHNIFLLCSLARPHHPRLYNQRDLTFRNPLVRSFDEQVLAEDFEGRD